MEDQEVNSIDEMSNENNTLPDELFIEENQQTPPPVQVVQSSEENTSIEKADEQESQQETKVEIPHKEDTTQFEYWQGEADRRARELEDFKTQYAQDKQTWENTQREIASVKEQLIPKADPLVAPVRPGTQFVDDVETWARYYEDKDAYRDKISEKRQGEFNTFKQESADEKQLRLDGEQAAQVKAYTLGEFQKRGMDREKASRALSYFSQQRENPDAYYDDLTAYFDWKENQAPDNRANQIQKRVERQGEVAPLGIQTSETETKKISDDDAFFGEMNKERKYY